MLLRQAILFPLVLVGGCAADGPRTRWLSESRQVDGRVDFNGADGSKLVPRVINSEGERQESGVVEWNSTTGKFRLNLTHTDITEPTQGTLSERMAALGDALPAVASAGFADRVESAARIEIAPAQLDESLASQVISYQQILFPFVRQDSLSEKKVFSAGDISPPVSVGAVKVRVVDSENNPVPDAQLVGVVGGRVALAGVEKPLWHLPLFRPILTRTSASGDAWVFPLSIEGDSPTYQLIVQKSGYCTYVSGERKFAAGRTTPELLQLRSCNQEVVGLRAKFVSPALTFAELIGQQEEPVGHTNSQSLVLRIDTVALPTFGYTLTVKDGHGDDGTVMGEPLVVSRFVSDLGIVLTKFPGTNPDGGLFTLKISPGDNPQGAVFLYGRRSLQRPTGLFLQSLEVRSATGSSNLVSGGEDLQFSVSSDECLAGNALGIQIGSSDVVFSDCVDRQATFYGKDLDLPGAGLSLGGRVSFAFFIRNKYGNVNEKPADDSHIKAIFVDYGVPVLHEDAVRFRLDFGLALVGALAGREGSTYSFPEGQIQDGEEGTTDTIIIRPNALDAVVARFAAPDHCKVLNGTQADGKQEGDDGIRIDSFALGQSSEFTSCTKVEDGISMASDRTLTIGDVTFPDSGSGPAQLHVRIKDAAGHISNLHSYAIPMCEEDVESNPGTPLCWRP